MKRMTIRATVVRALAAGAMLAGVTAVVAPSVASAAVPPLGPGALYVRVGGTSSGCLTKTFAGACGTLTKALTAEAAIEGASGDATTIVVYPGTYNTEAPIVLSAANAGVVIEAKNPKKPPVISPTVTASGASLTIPDAAAGVTLTNITVDASHAGTSAGAVTDIQLGNATGSTGSKLNNVNVSGADTAGGGVGVAVVGGDLTQQLKVNAIPSSCTAVIKKGSEITPGATNAIIGVSKVCTPFTNGETVQVGVDNATPVPNPITWTANKLDAHDIQLSSPSGTVTLTQAGASVVYNPNKPPYTLAGIECASGTCNIQGSNLNGTGLGTQNGIIVASGASATIGGVGVGQAGNKIGGNGGDGIKDASGYGVAAGTVSIEANTISNNGSVVASPVPNAGIQVLDTTATLGGALNIGTSVNTTGNTLSGNNDGIELVGAAVGVNQSAANVKNNSVTGSVNPNNIGANILLAGAVGVTVGGASGASANTSSGGALGLYLSGGAAANNVSYDSFSGNVAGIVVGGEWAPDLLGGPQANSAGNGINHNSFTGQQAADIIDFTGFNSIPGKGSDSNAAAGPVTPFTAVTAGSKVCFDENEANATPSDGCSTLESVGTVYDGDTFSQVAPNTGNILLWGTGGNGPGGATDVVPLTGSAPWISSLSVAVHAGTCGVDSGQGGAIPNSTCVLTTSPSQAFPSSFVTNTAATLYLNQSPAIGHAALNTLGGAPANSYNTTNVDTSSGPCVPTAQNTDAGFVTSGFYTCGIA